MNNGLLYEMVVLLLLLHIYRYLYMLNFSIFFLHRNNSMCCHNKERHRRNKWCNSQIMSESATMLAHVALFPP